MEAKIIYGCDEKGHPKYGKTRIYPYHVNDLKVESVAAVATLAEVILFEIYREFNHVDGTEYISTAKIEDRSMSVGDMVEFEDGRMFLCMPMGWAPIDRFDRACMEVLDWSERSRFCYSAKKEDFERIHAAKLGVAEPKLS